MLGNSAPPDQRISILLVDDDSAVRDSLAEQLTNKFGSEVEISEADCGQRAITMLEHETYDAVICDLDMPNGSGMSVFVFLRRAKLDPYFIFFTSARSVDLPSFGAKFLGVIQKPDAEIIIEKLEKCLPWKM